MSSNALVGGGEVASEPHTKKQRTGETRKNEFQPDGPVEDEATAREKMEYAGLDPNDVKKQCRLTEGADEEIYVFGDRTMSPMSYFGHLGDLKMCRYLLFKGASTSEASEYQYNGKRCWWFPMYAAAIGGQLEVCEWLYKHGAEGDIKKTNEGDYSPLHCSFETWCKRQHDGAVSRWLILKGVLSDDAGRVDAAILRRDLDSEYDPDYDVDGWIDERSDVLHWAQEAVQAHDNFMMFLMGTTPKPAFSQEALRKLLLGCNHSGDAGELLMNNNPEEQYELLYKKITESRRPLSCLAGKIGLLEHIADYAGVVRGRDLLILRSLVGSLSEYLEENPARVSVTPSSDEEGESDEED